MSVRINTGGAKEFIDKGGHAKLTEEDSEKIEWAYKGIKQISMECKGYNYYYKEPFEQSCKNKGMKLCEYCEQNFCEKHIKPRGELPFVCSRASQELREKVAKENLFLVNNSHYCEKYVKQVLKK